MPDLDAELLADWEEMTPEQRAKLEQMWREAEIMVACAELAAGAVLH